MVLANSSSKNAAQADRLLGRQSLVVLYFVDERIGESFSEPV